MKLTKLSSSTASVIALETLKLHGSDLATTESLSASLRRAASFMCPTSPTRLVDAVLDAILPLCPDGLTRQDVSDVLELLVAAGDLLELRQEGGRSRRLLYLAPPSYIERMPGKYLLIGVRPFGAALIEDDVAKIEYEGHTRILTLTPGEAVERLQALGLHAIPKDRWVASPGREESFHLVDRYRALLDTGAEGGYLEGLQLLDPTTPVRYYRGRWRSPDASDNGDFVARRPQAFGADLWCLIRFRSGQAIQVLELPVDNPLVPGRDEAWRYQAAIDNLRGAPQEFRVRSGPNPDSDTVFEFFSPLPGFAERYLRLVGLSLAKAPGTLFSYRVPVGSTSDVSSYLIDILWMRQEEAKGEL